MLILSRKPSESIVITGAKPNDKIEVRVLGTIGLQTKLGIDAPSHVSVNRAEIQDRIDAGIPYKEKS